MKIRLHNTPRLLAIASIATLVHIPHDVLAQTDDVSQCGFTSSARFVEGAPRDRFRMQNESSGEWDITSVSLDLSTSAGNLIFDITADGAGVEVFQPFRGESGSARLQQSPEVLDGDQNITLTFEQFAPANNYVFSIDVDDQLSTSDLGQIRVSGAEIQGATMTMNIVNQHGKAYEISGAFDDTNQVILVYSDC